MQEQWKPIKGYEGLYAVSDLGRVQNLQSGRLRKTHMMNRGYLEVALFKDGMPKRYLVHRLVAEAFCEKAEGNNIVDHINGRQTDNRAFNLRWTTQKENVRSGSKVRPVVRGDGKVYPSVRAVAEDGFNAPSVCECCQGKQSMHQGYTWSYVI